MSRFTNIIVWSIIIIGVIGLISNDTAANPTFFVCYKTIIELYLFGFTAFLILKRIFFYRIKGNLDVIQLVKKSDFQINLLWQGFVLALIYLVYNRYFYDSFSHFNTVLIAILLLFYVVQLFMNSNPSIYVDEETFTFDDFFVKRWKWQDIKQIELENQMMRLISEGHDFELDFDLVDDVDYIKLNDEVEHNILDGNFATEEASKTLVEILQTYANLYNVRLVNSKKRSI